MVAQHYEHSVKNLVIFAQHKFSGQQSSNVFACRGETQILSNIALISLAIAMVMYVIPLVISGIVFIRLTSPKKLR